MGGLLDASCIITLISLLMSVKLILLILLFIHYELYY